MIDIEFMVPRTQNTFSHSNRFDFVLEAFGEWARKNEQAKSIALEINDAGDIFMYKRAVGSVQLPVITQFWLLSQ